MRSLLKLENCDRLYFKCQAQQDNTQNQIAQIQNAIVRSGDAITTPPVAKNGINCHNRDNP
ncbi:MAG: hypothetical protein QNJ70_26050 [Xenococcaceae cyanobacterium MO_207.B15]|nr:hypothetical protein [Xenococcaceae cyanobacterium MO_207.B15]